MKLSEDPSLGLHLLVAFDELEAVIAWLVRHGVRFREDPDASATCAGPVFGVLRFEADCDRAAIDAILAEYRG